MAREPREIDELFQLMYDLEDRETGSFGWVHDVQAFLSVRLPPYLRELKIRREKSALVTLALNLKKKCPDCCHRMKGLERQMEVFENDCEGAHQTEKEPVSDH
jgi:hypothetical protein